MKDSKEAAIARLAKACNNQGMQLLRGNDAIRLAERQLINVPNSNFFVGDTFVFPNDPNDIIAFPMAKGAPTIPKAFVTVKNKLIKGATFKVASLSLLLGKVYSCDVSNMICVNQCVADLVGNASDVAEAFNCLANKTFVCVGIKQIDSVRTGSFAGPELGATIIRQIPMFEVIDEIKAI